MDPNTQPAEVAETSPADELLDAFLGEEGFGVEDSKQFERRPEGDEEGDQPDAEAAESEEDEVEAEATEEGDEEAEDQAEEPDGGYVEHEGNRYTVSELLAAKQFQKQHEGQLEQLRNQVITEARKEVDSLKEGATKRQKEIDDTYEFLQTLIPNYERPSLSMLDRNSPDYDPDGYHYLNGQIDKIEARKADAARKVEEIRSVKAREASDNHAKLVRENADKLKAKYPDFDAAKANELAGALKKHYGFDDATLASVVDHRFFELAMDAAAYRASRDKGAPKPKEAKAAPKLVRSAAKAAPKGTPSKRKTDAERMLKKTGKITDREAIFGDFL